MTKKTETNTAPNLACEQCGHQNEAERVYCHSCGAKLDRSVLPVADGSDGKTETSEQARKRIAQMTNPNKGRGGLAEIKTAVNVLIYSSLLAAAFLVTQKPEGVPEVSKGLLERSIAGDLMDAQDSVEPRRLDFTQTEVNTHLQQVLKPKPGETSIPEFKRAYVILNPGIIDVGSEQSLFGLMLYSDVRYGIETKDGKVSATMFGGHFGRLAVHPKVMPYLDFFFQKLWTALARERKQMAGMQRVIVQKGSVTLVTKGGAAP